MTIAVHRRVHLGALAAAVIALPCSEFLLSLAQIVLLVNWIVEGVRTQDLKGRCRRAFTQAPSAVFLSFFGLHLLGLLWTSDLAWGFDLCRILLPVLVFGMVLASSPRLSARELRALLLLGAWSTVMSTILCVVLRYEVIGQGDYRDLSMFISHIRLALMLCLSIAALVVHFPASALFRAAHLAAIAWCVLILYFLSSLTGFFILAILAVVALVRLGRRLRPVVRYAVFGLMLGIFAAGVLYVRARVRDLHRAEPIDMAALPEWSAGGEFYYHERESHQLENGHYVWIGIADKELERGWERRSRMPFVGRDGRGQSLRATLIRYLASLGQRKDSVGLLSLSDADVRRIEQGIPSVAEGHVGPVRARIAEVMLELENYQRTRDPNAHSVAMRLEFLRVGRHLAFDHWLTGVGTGDTQQAFDAGFERYHSRLSPRWRLRAHNEYLTLWITFGLPGLLWCLFSWWWPAHRLRTFRHPLFVVWALIFLISCLSEDTVETQMGATFLALYYALFVFAAPITDRAGEAPVPAPPG